MRAIDEFVRINKIEGNVFMSFDLDEMKEYDSIACGALRTECPDFVLPVLFDNSTTVVTMRYSVPEHYVDIDSFSDEFEIHEVLTLYDHLLNILEECSDWFLLKSGFCLEEKHVYIDVQNHTMKLMYIPDAAEAFNEQDIKHLLISLLEKCNEASGGNIQLQLYKYFYKPKFSIAEFRTMLDNYLTSTNIKDKMISKEKKSELSAMASEPAPEKVQPVKEVEPIKEVQVEKEPALEPQKALEKPREEEEISPRSYYAPKANRSQLSQEEIEQMVKSIYSGKIPEDPNTVNTEAGQNVATTDTGENRGEDSIYGTSSKDGNKNYSSSKKKNLFDNVFAGAKAQPTTVAPSSGGHKAMLKSISTHARYDLPKQIEIDLIEEPFIIGRATRTGEKTGAHYEFSAEITPISRLHAQIERKDGVYYIQDLGSSNGTFVNGTKLEANKPCVIEDGDKIAFAIAYSKNSIEYAFVE